MKRLVMISVMALAAGNASAQISRHTLEHPPVVRSAPGQHSALDGFQFDGVLSDAVLKRDGQTRRQWLETYPKIAPVYWAAWDCKGHKCDAPYYVNIRAKAALIPRTDKDPKPANDSEPVK